MAEVVGEVGTVPHQLTDLEVLQGDAALDELALEDVEQRLHPEVVVRGERERGLRAVERDRALRPFEVVALGHFLRGLVHGVIDLLEVGAGGDVEGGERRHGGKDTGARSREHGALLLAAPCSLLRCQVRKLSSARAREMCRNRASAFSLICRTRSRVMPSCEPISSSVIGSCPSSPKYKRRILASRSFSVPSTFSMDSVRACSKISSSGPGFVVSGR